MTNNQIIFNERIRLMKEGLLRGTGEVVTVETADGNIQLEVPEEIHTYQGWKSRGFQVKRGQKSDIKFTIWKYVEHKKKEEEKTGNPLEDAPNSHMFLQMSAFFRPDQVERITVK